MKKKICLFLVFILIASCLYPQSITNIAPQEQEQKLKNLEFQLWKERLDKEKKERRDALSWLYCGVATMGMGTVFLILGVRGEEVGWYYSVKKENKAQMALGLISIGVGSFMAYWGHIKKVEAQESIDDLRREGEKKGFLTYSYNPANQTIYIGYRIVF